MLQMIFGSIFSIPRNMKYIQKHYDLHEIMIDYAVIFTITVSSIATDMHSQMQQKKKSPVEVL